jgi:hypothetical protein
MAILKKTLFDESLETVNVLVNDTDPNSKYFKITELPDTFTGGKNAFLIQGSPELVSDTIVKIQIRDSQGKIIYHEPGEGIPEYFEGTSKVVAVYIYPDTAFGPCTITILGELSEYSFNGVTIPVPENWKDTYNVKWEKQINVNPILANTSKIRFYRRPKIDISESILPIYNRNVSRLTISGSVNGTPILPSAGEDYRTFKGVSRYELSLNGLSQFSESMERETIQINGLAKSYSPIITDVTTNKKAFVDVPYYITGSSLPNYYSVTAFTSASYTMSYDATVTLTDSAINSSFATINITDLETFSGDVNRIKVYASSKNDLGDFQLLEDVQLESNELLLTSSFANQLNVRTGLFTNAILSSFWTSSAIETGVNLSVDNTTLLKSVLLTPQSDYSSSVGLFKFYNKESINFTKNTEYQLDFTPLLSAAADTFGGIEIYMSGSAFTPTLLETNYGKKIGDLTTNTQFRKYDKQQINFKPDADGVGNLVYVVKGGVWHISDISLRAAQESSFSPNEITLTVNVPVKINNETFDFKFELYDINNNYVPVLLEKEFTFSGGNDVDVRRDLQLNVSNNSFNFSTASVFPQFVTIDFTKTGLTGSVIFQSQSVDINGNLITGTPKPGTLDYVDVDTRTLSLANFTGSSALGVTVGAITYTASCEDVNRYFTIFRIDQGAPARLFYATADKNNFVFDPDDRYKSDITDDYIDIRLVRQNLPSFESEGFNITSGSEVGVPPKLTEIETIGNATVYRLYVTSSTYQSGSGGYIYDIGQSHYDFKYDTVDGDFTSSVTIDAVLKGDKGKGLIATSDRNQFFYKMTDLSPTPSSQTATILVKRQNLGSLSNTITYTKTGSGPNLTLVSQNVGNGVAQFTVDTSAYTYGMGETKYVFQATDLNGVIYYDEISLAAVIAESQISVNLTNENATLPARSTGWVASGSFVLTSGSVSVKVGGEDISRQEGLSTNNRFDVISLTGTNCIPNGGQGSNPSDATYGITSLSADTGSLSLVVRYKDGRGSTTDITKVVTYSKAKDGVPNVVVAVTPSAQTIEANSKGSGSATPNSLTITALEGNTSRFTSLGTPTYTNGLSGTTSTNTLTFTSNASSMSADTGQVTIPVNYTDSEGTTGTKNVVATISKARKAVPSVTISATPQSQTVAANAAGTQTGALTNVTISALEGTTNMFTSMSFTPANAVGFSTPPTVSGNTLTMTSAVMNADEASVTLTVVHTNSENTTGQTQTITIRASKIKQGESGVVVNLNPASQIVTLDNTGSYGTPTAFVVSVVEGATTYTYSSTLASNSTFKIINVQNAVGIASGGTATSNTITPTKPTTTAGTSVTFDVVYKNAAGTTSPNISQTHRVSVTLDGQTGPGVVFTGVWKEGDSYQFSTGAGTGRRDVVLWSTTGTAPYDTYYAAIRQHTAAAGNVANGAPHQTSQTGWESLGTQDFFVAAKIGLFEDSYVQSTLNIGTNNNGGVSSANITLAGGTTNPYLSIGQATQGYENDGIFLGRSSNVAKFSIVNGTTSFLKWTGTSLEIKGSLNFTNQSSVDLSGFGGYTTLSGSVNTAQLVANTATASAATAQTTANNAATAASNAATAASNAQSTATNAINTLQAVVDGNSTLTGTFINDNFIYSPNIAGQNGYFSQIFRVGSNGITLDGTNKSIYVGGDGTTGYYNNANTPFYFKSGSTDVFSLGNKLSFNGADLTVAGTINATAGNFSGNITSTATITGGTIIGGSINGGQINIGGNFNVNSAGNLTAVNAILSGSINAGAGNIGGFVLSPTTLTTTNEKLKIDTNAPAILLYQTAGGAPKVEIDAKASLTSPSAANINPTWASNNGYIGTEGNRTATESSGYGTTYDFNGVISDTFSLTQTGITNFTVYTPDLVVSQTAGTITASSNFPPTSPTYGGQSYASAYPYGRSAQAYFVLQLLNTSNAVVATSDPIGPTVYANGAYSYSYYYSPDGVNWQYQTASSGASATPRLTFALRNSTINVPATGTYKARMVLKLVVRPGYVVNYDNNTTTFYSNTATTNHGYSGVSLQITPNLNKVEITNGGIQVLTTFDSYVQIERQDNTSWNGGVLIRSIGGEIVSTAYGQHPDRLNNRALQMEGYAQLNGYQDHKIGSYVFGDDASFNSYNTVLNIEGRYSTTTAAKQSRVSVMANIYPYHDDRFDLGSSSYRWRDIFTNGAVTITSDATKKLDIQPSSLGLEFINKLQPKSYRMISGSVIYQSDWPNFIEKEIKAGERDDKGNLYLEDTIIEIQNPEKPPISEVIPGKRKHYGLIAQDVKEVLNEMNISTNDFAGYVEGNREDGTELGLRYEEFLSPMIKAIQELSAKVNELEAKISGSV